MRPATTGVSLTKALPTADAPSTARPGLSRPPWLLPSIAGAVGALLLSSLYLGVVTAAQSWGHALQLFATDRYFILAIAGGFGVQIGLFTYLRTGLRLRQGTASTTALAGAGTGTSTASMLACCAHHLTDALPLLGLSGVAIFLADYRTPLMLLGIATNVAGILVMVRLMRRMQRAAGRV